MSNVDKRALREAAEKAGSDKWQAKKINGDFYVIRNSSYEKQHGFTSYQPIAEIEHKPVRDFVAAANPATVLALLDELEAKDSTIATQQQETRTLLNALEAAGKRCAALAAENAGLKSKAAELVHEASEVYSAYNSTITEPDGDFMDMQTLQEMQCVETPATDAFLAEVRAQGVEMCSAEIQKQTWDEREGDGMVAAIDAMEIYAALLRKGVI